MATGAVCEIFQSIFTYKKHISSHPTGQVSPSNADWPRLSFLEKEYKEYEYRRSMHITQVGNIVQYVIYNLGDL